MIAAVPVCGTARHQAARPATKRPGQPSKGGHAMHVSLLEVGRDGTRGSPVASPSPQTQPAKPDLIGSGAARISPARASPLCL